VETVNDIDDHDLSPYPEEVFALCENVTSHSKSHSRSVAYSNGRSIFFFPVEESENAIYDVDDAHSWCHRGEIFGETCWSCVHIHLRPHPNTVSCWVISATCPWTYRNLFYVLAAFLLDVCLCLSQAATDPRQDAVFHLTSAS